MYNCDGLILRKNEFNENVKRYKEERNPSSCVYYLCIWGKPYSPRALDFSSVNKDGNSIGIIKLWQD